jgi:hypothetical protein
LGVEESQFGSVNTRVRKQRLKIGFCLKVPFQPNQQVALFYGLPFDNGNFVSLPATGNASVISVGGVRVPAASTVMDKSPR